MMRRIGATVAVLLIGLLAMPLTAAADEAGSPDVDSLAEALDLPGQAQQLREAGVEEAELSRALDALQQDADAEDDDQPSRAGQAARVLRSEAETAQQEGRMENFGEFVEGQVQEGKQGQELAESIRQKREGRVAPGERPDEAGERPDEAGERPDEAGERPDEAGEQRGEAGPDEAGERRERGGPGEAEDRREGADADQTDERRGRAEPDQPADRGAEDQQDDQQDDAPGESDRRRGR